MQAFKNLIAGEWVNATGGDTFENRNPAKIDEVIGTFPSATAEDVQHAIAAAKEAATGWANTPAPARGTILDKAAQIIDARQKELAEVLTREEGKTRAEATGEVLRTRYLQILCRRRLAPAVMSSPATPVVNCSIPAANRLV
ncbi:MAG: aldehyde dehydrogenase family protein [Caldilineaceae bacterium]